MRSGGRVLDLGWTSGGGRVVPTGNTVGAQRPYHYWGCTGAATVSGPLGRKEGPWWNAGFFASWWLMQEVGSVGGTRLTPAGAKSS